jgi:VanZ family protein
VRAQGATGHPHTQHNDEKQYRNADRETEPLSLHAHARTTTHAGRACLSSMASVQPAGNEHPMKPEQGGTERRGHAAISRPLPRQLAKYWGVVIAWMTVISLLSTEPFSAANTNGYIDPVLRFFFPHLTPAGFVFAHYMVRKTAHFSEFFVLGLLSFWASRRGRMPRWRAAWMAQTLGLAVVYALVDEAHQIFVPSRTPSLVDSCIDSLGAAASQVIVYLRHLFARQPSGGTRAMRTSWRRLVFGTRRT